MKRTMTTAAILIQAITLNAQVDTLLQVDTVSTAKVKYQQQPGLALAASKIFFSDKKYSISGFGEFNYVPVQNNVNTEVGDLELYYGATLYN
ncbi:hypothetical protein BC792_12371 [Sphingobacterium allocomposti]|uniref:Uncharacterized protein n=2 Tax=Sphingobacterium allocomposti TaxID=415956 RepID=A0A5S5D4L4_9SPHI|nr:hypothetical protein BC792_12371 [Sphingobacterium composti Yoo et al. 2007 non Ten et al. 2007]